MPKAKGTGVLKRKMVIISNAVAMYTKVREPTIRIGKVRELTIRIGTHW